MLRRFSVNFAVFSMLLDGIAATFCLWLAAAIRPSLSDISFFKSIDSPINIPYQLYLLFPCIWVVVFSSLSIYDGRKFLRAADELAALMLATIIASISTAGILYFSFRDVSRALYVVFVLSAFLTCLLWRALARIYFRARRESLPISRRVLVVGMGPLGQSVGKQIQNSLPIILGSTNIQNMNGTFQARQKCIKKCESFLSKLHSKRSLLTIICQFLKH